MDILKEQREAARREQTAARSALKRQKLNARSDELCSGSTITSDESENSRSKLFYPTPLSLGSFLSARIKIKSFTCFQFFYFFLDSQATLIRYLNGHKSSDIAALSPGKKSPKKGTRSNCYRSSSLFESLKLLKVSASSSAEDGKHYRLIRSVDSTKPGDLFSISFRISICVLYISLDSQMRLRRESRISQCDLR